MRGREEEYFEVLYPMEQGVLEVYAEHEELLDSQVDTAFERLFRIYRAEHTNHILGTLPPLRPIEQAIFDAVQPVCEQALGRAESRMSKTISMEELLECIKRIRSSIKFWSKEGGIRGYLGFIDQYVP